VVKLHFHMHVGLNAGIKKLLAKYAIDSNSFFEFVVRCKDFLEYCSFDKSERCSGEINWKYSKSFDFLEEHEFVLVDFYQTLGFIGSNERTSRVRKTSRKHSS
jgi:hypothetical protein